jgi:hypothetical protein
MSESFDIFLDLAGDEGAQFRHQNDGDEIERTIVIDRGEALVVTCELLPAIHGQYTPDSYSPASLVIFDFSFLPTKHARRFLEAEISVIFADEERGGQLYDPEVKEISFSPSGQASYLSMFPTTRRQEVARGVQVLGGGGAFGASLTAGFFWELSETKQSEDAAALVARKRVRGRGKGGQNAAEWSLLENSSTRSGIPTFFRAAVLLLRPDFAEGRRFTAMVTIKAKVDLLTSIEEGVKRVLGKISKVDPIIFDPEQKDPPATTFDRTNLGGQALSEISLVLSKNILPEAV